jgi:hypothetical protein
MSKINANSITLTKNQKLLEELKQKVAELNNSAKK